MIEREKRKDICFNYFIFYIGLFSWRNRRKMILACIAVAPASNSSLLTSMQFCASAGARIMPV